MLCQVGCHVVWGTVKEAGGTRDSGVEMMDGAGLREEGRETGKDPSF